MTTPQAHVSTLANGVRVVALALPQLESASASVFVRTGSACESARESGISHVVEHMAFKGTQSRDCQRINLDAERLGAEVNAHTDKDHTAFHMRGLAQHATTFVAMLGDIVCASTFPEAELERERQVILHEVDEDDDDPLATAFKLFDRACYGNHPAAQPVIGRRRNIERFTRADIQSYVQRQYTGANIVVGVAGAIDPAAVHAAAEAAFSTLPKGEVNRVAAPVYAGGVRLKRQTGSSQTHAVIGFPIPSLADDDAASVVAAALFGEGMSSPLMDALRERRALVYYAACSADRTPWGGQFVIEASTAPRHLDELVAEVARLLVEQTRAIDPIGLERARNQLAVRRVQALERPPRLIEDAAQDLFVHGRVRSRAEQAAQVDAVTADAVRDAFRRMLAATPAVAVAGRLGKGLQAGQRFGDLLAAGRR